MMADGSTFGSFEHFDAEAVDLHDNAKLECGVCWTIYDPTEGDAINQIAPGTPFKALPEDWRCPVCDTEKRRFLVVEDGSDPQGVAVGPASTVIQEDSSGGGEPPAERLDALVSAHRQIQETGMRDVPILNLSLQVETIGFRSLGDDWIGMLITPWFINLVLLPGDCTAFRARQTGDKVKYSLPAGRFEFIVGHLEGYGVLPSCSLFSPVTEFENQDAARIAAQAAIEAIFDPQTAHEDDTFTGGETLNLDEPIEDPIDPDQEASSVSRRDLLRGQVRQSDTAHQDEQAIDGNGG
ncbi:MAG: [NiFe]-hydrogenase assembly chaperone HybE [Magnetovibrionaceae bacterium]